MSAPPRNPTLAPRPRHRWVAALVLITAPCAVANELELGVRGDLQARLDQLLQEHDAAIVRGDADRLREMYADDFRCQDLGVHTGEQMISSWLELHHRFRKLTLKTRVLHVDRLNSVAAVTCSRPFTGIDRESDNRVSDDFGMTFLIALDQGVPGTLFAAFLNGDQGDGIDRSDRQFLSESLDVAFDLPESLLPISRSPTGASLMELLLIDPVHSLRLQVIVHQSSYPTCLVRALSCDSPVQRIEHLKWLSKPREVLSHEPFLLAASCEFYLPTDVSGRELEEPWHHRMLYLSEDGEVLVQLIADGPRGSFQHLRDAIETISGSIRWAHDPGADTASLHHAQRLLKLNPHWNTVENGIFRHPWVELSMIVPSGLHATPLAGDREIRMRLVLDDDPGTSMCLTIYECGDHSPCPEKEAKNLLSAITCVMCRPGTSPRPKQIEKMQLLDTTGVCVVLPMVCAAGMVHTHRALALTRPPHHLQLQLVPASEKKELQEELFQQTLTALEWD